MNVGTALSELPQSKDAVADACSQLFQGGHLEKLGVTLCWATPHHADQLPAILNSLATRLGNQRIVGCIAPGIIIGNREVRDGPGFGLMTFGGEDADRFSIRRTGELKEMPEKAAQNLVHDTQLGDLIIAMPTVTGFQEAPFLRSARSSSAHMVGGGASNPGGEDLVFTGHGPLSNGAVALVIRDCSPVTAITHACRPISPVFRVSESIGKVLTGLDGRPAIDVLRTVLQGLDTGRTSRSQGQVMVAISELSDGGSMVRGDYRVRPILGMAPGSASLFIGEHLNPGTGITFVSFEAEACRSDLNLMLLEAQEKLCNIPPQFITISNCTSRGTALHDIPDYEASVLHSYMGGVPQGGFFGGFELAPLQGQIEVHMFTAAIAMGTA